MALGPVLGFILGSTSVADAGAGTGAGEGAALDPKPGLPAAGRATSGAILAQVRALVQVQAQVLV